MTKLGQQLAIGYYRAKFKVLSAISNRKAAELALDLFTTPQYRDKKPLPPIFKESEKLSFKHFGETVTGYRWNRGGHRKVLIVHGFNSSVAKFDRYIKPLMRKGYEVLAFDAPAHGYSTGKTLNAVVFKKMIEYIHKEYGPVRSYMGHSFGGLAICLALEEIEHNEDYRVALIAPATESRTAFDTFFTFLKLNEDVRKEFHDRIFKLSNKPSDWYSVSRAIKNLQAKILWCHDENDTMTPWSDARKVMDEKHFNIEFILTKGLGHRRIYRDNKVSKAIIEFL
ncbi:MAG TPA: alpha/beta fold hydrolase [Chitinophagaceae bacterium]